MKSVYVLAQGHSGSTLIDCILGTHPEFFSSGELRYLNWQIERTKDTPASVEGQNICTCEKDWRECAFWSQVFREIKRTTGQDIIADPLSFDTKYFGQFSYQQRGGHSRSRWDRWLGFLFRLWLEKGLPLSAIAWLRPEIRKQIQNNWLLYELMAQVSGKPIIVDSSKHLLIALLLQQHRPNDVWILFVHRDLRRLAASSKKLAARKGIPFSIHESVRQNQIFEQRVTRYKRAIPGLNYLDCTYEDVVRAPADFLSRIVTAIGASNDYSTQPNAEFWIDPRSYHMVAGNPMRYRGRQMVKSDDSWKSVLTAEELTMLESSR